MVAAPEAVPKVPLEAALEAFSEAIPRQLQTY